MKISREKINTKFRHDFFLASNTIIQIYYDTGAYNSNCDTGSNAVGCSECAQEFCSTIAPTGWVTASTDDCGNVVVPIAGCTDPNYANYNENANSDDGSCADVITFGCMLETACNYNTFASNDCSNSAVTTDEPIGNTDCCTYAYSVCYLDLNNNGYYEEKNTTVSTCN